VGMALFTDFALPFEIASLILLAAIIGAVVIAKKKVTS
jgi:NADH-quinone oxidoreductase subunit J